MKTNFLILVFCLLVSSSMGQYVFDSCLVAYYPFNGNANDVIHENNGVVLGPVLTFDRFGVDSAAYSFDGIDDLIVAENKPQINPENITICVWYKTVSFEGIGNNAIIDKPFDTLIEPYYQYHIGVVGDLYPNNSYARFQTDLTVDSIRVKHYTEDNYWTPGEWYFLCTSFDGTYYRTYINGVLFDSIYNPGTITSYNGGLYFGKFGNYESYTPGIIDDVRIYSCALDQESISVLYNADYSNIEVVDSKPLVNIYPNPTRQDFTVESGVKIGFITLSNLLGVTVLKQDEDIDNVSLRGFEPGLYILRLYGRNHQLLSMEKVIKQ